MVGITVGSVFGAALSNQLGRRTAFMIGAALGAVGGLVRRSFA